MGCCFTVETHEEPQGEVMKRIKKVSHGTPNLSESCKVGQQQGQLQAPLLGMKGKVVDNVSITDMNSQGEAEALTKTMSSSSHLSLNGGISRGSSRTSYQRVGSFRDRKPQGLNDIDERLVRLNTRSPKGHPPSRTTHKYKKSNRTMSL
eukprot:TRINITY_DN4407_c1_g1_i1.p1 TRINITY_DN4407_c1_g1~~TRINITY_DN4407_c1_g1_i1.p1  ORF type:complete len:171 (+),score=29.24 TRINITY_DN4407_c1_g1_i1:68-514(+)